MRPTLFLLLSLTVASYAGGIYWTDRNGGGNRAIRKAQLNGTSPSILFNLGVGADPRGIVVVQATEKIYFCNRVGTNGVLVANLDGSGSPTAVISSGFTSPADLQYLPPSTPGAPGQLYVADENANAIRRLDTDGSNLTTLITANSPYYLDLDPAAGKIYWGNSGSALTSGPLAGGTPGPALFNGGQNMRGVCVDPTRGMVYWCEKDSGTIKRLPVTGGNAEILYAGLHTPHGLYLDIPAGKLYWADSGTNNNPAGFNARGISRGDMNGFTESTAEALVTSFNSAQAWDVSLDTRTPTYAEWCLRYFRADAPGTILEFSADPDNDGVPNFMEFGLGTGPMNHDSTPTSTSVRVTDGGVDYPGVQFRRRIGTTDVVYHVQVSTNLASWVDNTTHPGTTIEVSPAQAVEDGMEIVTVRSTVPLTVEKQFFRVKVAAP